VRKGTAIHQLLVSETFKLLSEFVLYIYLLRFIGSFNQSSIEMKPSITLFTLSVFQAIGAANHQRPIVSSHVDLSQQPTAADYMMLSV